MLEKINSIIGEWIKKSLKWILRVLFAYLSKIHKYKLFLSG